MWTIVFKYRFFFRTFSVVQDEHKWFVQFQKIIMKQSSKVMHPQFQRADYSYHKIWIRVCTYGWNCFLGHCSQENGDTCVKSSVSHLLIKQDLWNEDIDIFKWNLEWIHLLSHPCMHFANISVRQVVCVKRKFHFLHRVWLQLDYKLNVCRITNIAHIEHL
jgi:hypothetical protein